MNARGLFSSILAGWFLLAQLQVKMMSTEEPKGARRYVVQAGDGLWAIARQFRVSEQGLVDLNRLTDPNLLAVGQVLDLGPEALPRFSKIGDSLSASRVFLRAAGGWSPSSQGRRSEAVWAGVSSEGLLVKRQQHGHCAEGENLVECELRIEQPQVVVLLVGTNDARAGISPEDYQLNLTRIVDLAMGAGAMIILTTLPPLTGEGSGLIEKYNETIRDLAQALGVEPLEWGAGAQMGPDGVHPTADSIIKRNEMTLRRLEELREKFWGG